jgi:hypothetical protein
MFIWKSSEAMTSGTNMFWSYFLGLATSIIFVLVYVALYNGLPGKKGSNKGIVYGFIVWLVGSLSGMISMPFYMNIAWAVVIYWIIQALVFNFIRGLIVGGTYKEK